MPGYNMGGNSSSNLTPQGFFEMQRAMKEDRLKMLQLGGLLLTYLGVSNQQTVEAQRSGPIADNLKDARDALKAVSLTPSSDADKCRNATVDCIDEILRGFQAGSTASSGLLGGGSNNGNRDILLIAALFMFMGGGV